MKKIISTAVLVLILAAAGMIWFFTRSSATRSRSGDEAYHESVLAGDYGGHFVSSSTDKPAVSPAMNRFESPDLRKSLPGEAAERSEARIRVAGNNSLSAEIIAGNISIPADATKEELEAIIRNQVVALYHSLGLIPTKITHLEIHDGDPPTIELSISEGAFHRFGTVEVRGDSGGIQDTGLLPKPGEAVDYSQINQTRAGFQSQLADLGYLDASLVPVINLDSTTGTMDLTLDISQGQRYRVGRISAPPGLSLPLRLGDFFLQRLLRAYLESIGISSQKAFISQRIRRLGPWILPLIHEQRPASGCCVARSLH